MKHRSAIIVLAILISPGVAHAVPSKRGDTPDARRATTALNILEARGFATGVEDKSRSAFADVHPHGKDFMATIVQNGRTFVLMVDPDTGQISRQN